MTPADVAMLDNQRQMIDNQQVMIDRLWWTFLIVAGNFLLMLTIVAWKWYIYPTLLRNGRENRLMLAVLNPALVAMQDLLSAVKALLARVESREHNTQRALTEIREAAAPPTPPPGPPGWKPGDPGRRKSDSKGEGC